MRPPLRAALAILPLTLAACGIFGPKEDPPPPPLSPLVSGVEFDDIPVPRDFTQIRERSKVVVAASFRSGTLAYRGFLRQETLRDWYKRVMPAAGWTQSPPPAGETGVGPYTLRFEKSEERCEVVIDAPAAETFVTLTLGLK